MTEIGRKVLVIEAEVALRDFSPDTPGEMMVDAYDWDRQRSPDEARSAIDLKEVRALATPAPFGAFVFWDREHGVWVPERDLHVQQVVEPAT